MTTSRDSFRASISAITNVDLKGRLDSIEGDIVQASDEFEAAAAAVTLHELEVTDGVAGTVTTNEMVRLYDRSFARQGSAGRAIYDAIRAASKNDACPLCGKGTVWTLDHHLPKTSFPALAVAPLNLVPACMECNKFKLATAPHTAEDETLHPYFDDIEDEPWLVAEVLESRPPAIRYSVNAPNNWTALLADRVRRHFVMLKLPYRYGVEAAREVANLRGVLADLFAKGGLPEVRRHLTDMADSYEATRTNSWQTAMYKAMASSDWYCGGGFEL